MEKRKTQKKPETSIRQRLLTAVEKKGCQSEGRKEESTRPGISRGITTERVLGGGKALLYLEETSKYIKCQYTLHNEDLRAVEERGKCKGFEKKKLGDTYHQHFKDLAKKRVAGEK